MSKRFLPYAENQLKKTMHISGRFSFGSNWNKAQRDLWNSKNKRSFKDQIEIRSDYDKNKRFSIDNLRIPCPYDGILIGPIAHKVLDINDYNSVIES